MVPPNFVLSDVQKGGIAFFIGLILLLHTLGVFTTGLSIILILLSIALMIYGFIKANLYQKTLELIQRAKKGKKP